MSAESKMAQTMPLVSIIMGTYNGEKYLREQLTSIYAQTYPNLEVIVCDDHSTDHTVAILEEFSRQLGLVYQVNERNLGLVKNFEKALTLAKGEYIALADQDDIWYPHKIDLLLKNIGDCSLIHSAVHVIDGKGQPHNVDFVVSEYSKDHALKVKFTDFLDTAWVLGCTSLMRRELLNASLPFPEGVMFHDWWLTMTAIKLGHGIRYIHEPTIQYRQYGENTAFKFFTDISWHKKRFDFYQLLASEFADRLTEEEKTRLDEIALQNAADYIIKAVENGHRDLAEQFLRDHKELIELPFIQALIQSARQGPYSPGRLKAGENPPQDPVYRFIQKLRRKIDFPVSGMDKAISKAFKYFIRPLFLRPMKAIYHRFHRSEV